MKLTLEGVAVKLDGTGHVKSRILDCSGIALKLDGTEIDGVSFSFNDNGDIMEITMEGDDLSDEIRPNYPAASHTPVMQVSFKSAEARTTANTINKLMRRANKEFPRKAIMIRDVRGLE